MISSPESGAEQGANTAPPASVPTAPPSLIRRVLIPAVKFGIAFAALYYVLETKMNDEAKRELKRLFLDSPRVLVLSMATFSIQLMIGAHRLRLLLVPQGVKLRYFQSLRLTYLGAFFDTFMITSVGGDAVKAIYLARESPPDRRLQAVSVLILDRLIGLLALLSLMVGMMLLYYAQLSADPDVQPYIKWLLVVPVCLLIGTAMLLSENVYRVFSALMRLSNRYRILKRLEPVASLFDRVYATLQKFRDRPLVLLHVWMVSLGVHLFGVFSGYILLGGRGQGNKPFGPFLVAWFIANFICSFAPAGGIGVGQLVYDPIFFKIANVTSGVVLATAVQATAILAKMPGLIAWLISREGPSPPPPLAVTERG